MNVLYTLSTLGKGVGGHYFSYKTIVEAMQDNVTPVLVNLQLRDSCVFESIECEKYKINIKTINLPKIIMELIDICKKHKINCIHTFDIVSYFFIRAATSFYKLPVIVTVCGGENPKSYFPKLNHLTLFSEENFDYFLKNKKKYGIKSISFIPNRVSSFSTDQQKIEELKNKYNLIYQRTILRISRINHYYESSLLQSIELVKEINKQNHQFKLLIVGEVIDNDLYKKLLLVGKNYVHIEKDKRFYNNAKELIGIGMLNISTGRSVMESFSKNIITLTPLKNKKYPVLLDQDTFEKCFYTNFSERNRVDLDDNEILNKTLKIIENDLTKKSLYKFYNEKFKKYFDIESAKDEYLELYVNLLSSKMTIPVIDIIRHYFFIIARVISHTTVLNKKNIKSIYSLIFTSKH